VPSRKEQLGHLALEELVERLNETDSAAQPDMCIDELLARWERAAGDDVLRNRIRDILKPINVRVPLSGARRTPQPPTRLVDGLPVAIRNRWLFELEGAIRAQPRLNQVLTPMVAHDRGKQLVRLFVRLASSGQSTHRVLCLFIAWGLKSTQPLVALGLRHERPGNPAAKSKMTAAERIDYGLIVADRISKEERKHRAMPNKVADDGKRGSIRFRVIDQFSRCSYFHVDPGTGVTADQLSIDLEAFSLCLDEFDKKFPAKADDARALSTRTIEDLLRDHREEKRDAKRLNNKVMYPGTRKLAPLPIPKGISLEPADLLAMLNRRGVLKFLDSILG
jgi:hypothetical protein